MSLLNYIEQSPTQTMDASDVAIVIAHPDDEAIACGALMSRLRNVNVVFVTDGSPVHGPHAARAGCARRWPSRASARNRSSNLAHRMASSGNR